jgi:hypothetical protein
MYFIAQFLLHTADPTPLQLGPAGGSDVSCIGTDLLKNGEKDGGFVIISCAGQVEGKLHIAV